MYSSCTRYLESNLATTRQKPLSSQYKLTSDNVKKRGLWTEEDMSKAVSGVNSGNFYHEECVGLTAADKDIFICANCDQ
uniref:Uncharacterized protein n=1 Tax=Timema shepardi TaxID=629360 RepID=A0A7R9G6L6_TIMSH|nr:unnamed protein product [Timema shepardi]